MSKSGYYVVGLVSGRLAVASPRNAFWMEDLRFLGAPFRRKADATPAASHCRRVDGWTGVRVIAAEDLDKTIIEYRLQEFTFD